MHPSGRTSREQRGGDSGLTIVLVALLMIVMLLFAAFAVDLASVYNARRLDQNAADVGALAAAQDLTLTDAILIARAKQYANDALGVQLTDAQWNSCGSIAPPPSTTIKLAGASCISTSAGRRRVGVRIPVQQYETSFARVVGLGSFDHSAFAVAGVVTAGFGGILPFGIPASANSADGYFCIKTTAQDVEPCTGPTQGNFGPLDFAYYGAPETVPEPDCGNGQQLDRFSNNIAVGVDHDMSTLDGSPWFGTAVVDTRSPCAALSQPNSMDVLTGNAWNPYFSPGIYDGGTFTDGQGPRLQRTAGGLLSGAQTAFVGGNTVDDNPLWMFITPGLNSTSDDVPESCEENQFMGSGGGLGDGFSLPTDVRNYLFPSGNRRFDLAVTMRKLLQRCFTHYNNDPWTDNGAMTGSGSSDPLIGCGGNGCTGVVFGKNSSTTDGPDLYDIQYTPRFAYVPKMTTDFGPGGSSYKSIRTFQAIYLQNLFGGCNGQGVCELDFDPGVNYGTTSTVSAAGISAFVFPSTILPNGLAGENAPFQIGKNRFIQLVR